MEERSHKNWFLKDKVSCPQHSGFCITGTGQRLHEFGFRWHQVNCLLYTAVIVHIMEVSVWKGFRLLQLNLEFYSIRYLWPPGKLQGYNSSFPCSLLLRSNQNLHWVVQGWCNSWFSLEYHPHKSLDKKTIGSIHHSHQELQRDIKTCQAATYI